MIEALDLRTRLRAAAQPPTVPAIPFPGSTVRPACCACALPLALALTAALARLCLKALCGLTRLSAPAGATLDSAR
jgi:hypothetical protein